MSLLFGNTPLLQITADQERWLTQFYRFEDIKLFEPPPWPGLKHSHLPWKPFDIPPLQFNTLNWPTGASRFAVGYYVITSDDDTSGWWTINGPQPKLLAIDDESGQSSLSTITTSSGGDGYISTLLYALSPLPLKRYYGDVTGDDPRYTDVIADAAAALNASPQSVQQPLPGLTDNNSLYLLPLVDVRYFWWQKAISESTQFDPSTWDSLIRGLLSACGVTDADIESFPTPDPNYLTPSWRWWERTNTPTDPEDIAWASAPLPVLIDAALYQIGMRFVRRLDGKVEIQNVETAFTAQESQWQDFAQLTGGRTPDADKLTVPASVTVVFDRAFYPLHRSNYSINVPLNSLDLASFEGYVSLATTNGSNLPSVYTSGTGSGSAIFGNEAFTKVLIADTPALMNNVNCPPRNNPELMTLANQIAKDWYLWQMTDCETAYNTIVGWVPNGTNDMVVWRYTLTGDGRGPLCSTKITKPPMFIGWDMTAYPRELRSESGILFLTGQQDPRGFDIAWLMSVDPETNIWWPFEMVAGTDIINAVVRGVGL